MRAPMRFSATPPARPLEAVQDNHFLLELFHGPRSRSRIFAMQLNSASCSRRPLQRRGERGDDRRRDASDTGSAGDGGVFRGLRRGRPSSSSTRMAGLSDVHGADDDCDEANANDAGHRAGHLRRPRRRG